MLIHLVTPGLIVVAGGTRALIAHRKSRKIVKYLLDGHIISETDILSLHTYLLPNSVNLAKKLNQTLKSPQMIDLNKRQAQYLALQNQINPHFLYNTLESIRGEALIKGLNSVAEMSESLAKFFRYTITKVENLVTVEDELENCQIYFRIQKYRFGDRLELNIQCDSEEYETIMSCKIPKLTLQPILENSIIHGTEMKMGTSHITIDFQVTEKRLLIRVSDDGSGMDEKTLAKLNRKLGYADSSDESSQESEVSGGIALKNVNNRIHLIYGEEYGIHIYSILHKGTDVEISIPLQHQGEGI
ncbi:MAG: histidine kinase [Lachnospiraceae bacterium]|nr:histidine kinase [Lachnospiraceae bacterium]